MSITVSLEKAKELIDAWFYKDTILYLETNDRWYIVNERDIKLKRDWYEYEAQYWVLCLPTAQEILDVLPKKIEYEYVKWKTITCLLHAKPWHPDGWAWCYKSSSWEQWKYCRWNNLANALADLWLRCKENRYI